MDPTSRRNFLKLCAASVPSLVVPRHLRAAGTGSDASPTRTPASIDRYIDPLPIPKRLAPTAVRGRAEIYRVRMMEFRRPLHSQLPPTTLWGFEGQYPGPTFEVWRGRPAVVYWENQLPEKHLFMIDPRIHGAMPPTPAVRTVPHLHGSRTRSESDGLPEKWYTPGTSVRYSYPNRQPAATLWYHDHALGITRLNVYAGLSGLYLLHDDEERRLELPSGACEIPLVLQDRTLDDQGQLVYRPTFEDGKPAPAGTWAPEFFAELPVVNGAIYPHLEVEPRPYRFRVLNGANSRFFNLFLNLAKGPTDVPSLVNFHQIGTDGGFMAKPVELTHLLLGPAERADLIVDFSGLEGKVVTLSNNAPAPYPGWSMLNPNHARLYELMRFRVSLPHSGGRRIFSLPAPPPPELPDPAQAATTRDFILADHLDSQGRTLAVRINHKGYDDPVTEVVRLGSTEKWRFINTTDDAHPMHLHLVQFEILERQGFDPAALMTRGKVVLIGAPRGPEANEIGRKDTAIVNPGDVLTILVRFDGYAGRYVYHCHMLEHEDNDMMRPYEVSPAGPRPTEY